METWISKSTTPILDLTSIDDWGPNMNLFFTNCKGLFVNEELLNKDILVLQDDTIHDTELYVRDDIKLLDTVQVVLPIFHIDTQLRIGVRNQITLSPCKIIANINIVRIEYVDYVKLFRFAFTIDYTVRPANQAGYNYGQVAQFQGAFAREIRFSIPTYRVQTYKFNSGSVIRTVLLSDPHANLKEDDNYNSSNLTSQSTTPTTLTAPTQRKLTKLFSFFWKKGNK